MAANIEMAPRDDEAVEDYVFVYKQVGKGMNTRFDFVRVYYTRAVCGDCDATYDAATWWWDEDMNGDPMLVCPCGGQLYSTCE